VPRNGVRALAAYAASAFSRQGQKVEDARYVSLIPCGRDGERHPGKNSTLYWAWTLADGSRRAYRQRLCIDCFRELAVPLISQSASDALICPVCGGSSVDDLDPVYLTYFLPSMPKGTCEFATDAACAARVRSWAMQGAQELEDRALAGAEASAPALSADAAWAALGLRPS
jgi:hypothetical protein